jgi:hypothetical protein
LSALRDRKNEIADPAADVDGSWQSRQKLSQQPPVIEVVVAPRMRRVEPVDRHKNRSKHAGSSLPLMVGLNPTAERRPATLK